MSDMQKFHTVLGTAAQGGNLYFKALTAITKASRGQRKAIPSDLSRQNWTDKEQESAN